jgi:hypothetical protein
MNRETRRKVASNLLWLLVLVFALASVASAEWKEKVLYSFQGGTDGAVPAGGVIFDQEGKRLRGDTGWRRGYLRFDLPVWHSVSIGSARYQRKELDRERPFCIDCGDAK